MGAISKIIQELRAAAQFGDHEMRQTAWEKLLDEHAVQPGHIRPISAGDLGADPSLQHDLDRYVNHFNIYHDPNAEKYLTGGDWRDTHEDDAWEHLENMEQDILDQIAPVDERAGAIAKLRAQ